MGSLLIFTVLSQADVIRPDVIRAIEYLRRVACTQNQGPVRQLTLVH